MLVDVYQTGVWQGSLTFQDGQVTVDSATDPTLRMRVDELRAGEIRPYQDYRIGDANVMVATPMRQDDPAYALGFCQCLERAGYEVVQRHPGVDIEIQHLVQQLQTDHPARKKLDELLPTMTHLEKTYIRDELRATLSKKQMRKGTSAS